MAEWWPGGNSAAALAGVRCYHPSDSRTMEAVPADDKELSAVSHQA